jgi:hypothetical protein
MHLGGLADPLKFYSYRRLMITFSLASNLSSMAIFISWLKLFKYLSILPTFRLFADTMKNATGPIVQFFSCLFIVFLACAQAFFLAFGPYLFRYRNFSQSVISLVQCSLGM